MATFEGLPRAQTLSIPAGLYPKLSGTRLERAERYGVRRPYGSTTRLYRQGERETDLYIVLAGSLQIFWFDTVEREEHFYTLEAGEFSGELNLLNQRETLTAARVLAGSSVLRVPRERLREFLTAEPEIGELVVRTIVQKRQWLVQRGAGGLALIGHGDDGETARLTGFLTANSYPFRAFDPRTSSAARALAEERGVHDSELPAVLAAKWVLKRPELRTLANKLGISENIRLGTTWDVSRC